MDETKKLIQQIIEGIQDKKGKSIVIADLSQIHDTICNYFIICQGNSPSQVTAIVESVKEFARKGAGAKPYGVDGLRKCMSSCRKHVLSTTSNICGPMPN